MMTQLDPFKATSPVRARAENSDLNCLNIVDSPTTYASTAGQSDIVCALQTLVNVFGQWFAGAGAHC